MNIIFIIIIILILLIIFSLIFIKIYKKNGTAPTICGPRYPSEYINCGLDTDGNLWIADSGPVESVKVFPKMPSNAKSAVTDNIEPYKFNIINKRYEKYESPYINPSANYNPDKIQFPQRITCCQDKYGKLWIYNDEPEKYRIFPTLSFVVIDKRQDYKLNTKTCKYEKV